MASAANVGGKGKDRNHFVTLLIRYKKSNICSKLVMEGKKPECSCCFLFFGGFYLEVYMIRQAKDF